MTGPSIEERLAHMFTEVAERLPEADGTVVPLRSPARIGRPWALLVATVAAMVLAVAGVVVLRDLRQDDRSGVVEPRGGADRVPDRAQGPGAVVTGRIDFVFMRDGSIWARQVDGTEVRLDGSPANPASWPTISPNGHLVIYGVENHDRLFWTPRMLDTRDGSVRETTFLQSFSPDGTLVAGSPPVDDEVPRVIEVVRSDGITPVASVTLPLEVTPWTLAWDHDGRGLLVVSRCCPTEQSSSSALSGLWYVDPTSGTVTELHPEGPAASWIVAEHAVGPGSFPAVRADGSTLIFGILHARPEPVSEATFEPIATLPTTGSGAVLDTTSPLGLYLDARSDGARYLFGDGHHLVELDSDGQLTPLADQVVNASAP